MELHALHLAACSYVLLVGVYATVTSVSHVSHIINLASLFVAGAPYTYNCTFPTMIDDWRAKWYQYSGGQTNPLFPFGFVQVCTTAD